MEAPLFRGYHGTTPSNPVPQQNLLHGPSDLGPLDVAKHVREVEIKGHNWRNPARDSQRLDTLPPVHKRFSATRHFDTPLVHALEHLAEAWGSKLLRLFGHRRTQKLPHANRPRSRRTLLLQVH